MDPQAPYSRIPDTSIENDNTGDQRDETSELSNNARHFDPDEQFFRLLRNQVWRWFVTAAFVAIILATFKIYENKGNFTSAQKTNYYVITTALVLGLGLNFFVSAHPRV